MTLSYLVLVVVAVLVGLWAVGLIGKR